MSLIGAGLAFVGINLITQCILIYVPATYPDFAASLLAANGLSRSLFAAAAILYAPFMFQGLGIAGGVAFSAAMTILCYVGLFILYFYGATLRAKSRFAIS